MAGNLVKKVMLKIVADDGDSEEKLDKISAKADELARKHPDIKVKVDSAAASAKLAVLRRELRDTGKESQGTSTDLRALARDAGLFGLGLSGGVSEMSAFGKLMAVMNIATGIGEPLIAGLTVSVMGLTSSLLAGGMGAGAFGLAVVGQMDSGSKSAKRLQSALMGAKKQWFDWSNSLAKPIDAPIYSLLKDVDPLLHDMTPFVTAASSAIGVLVGQFSRLVRPAQQFREMSGLGHVEDMGKSSSLQRWLAGWIPHVKPDLVGLGDSVGHVVSGIMGMFRAFLPESDKMIGGLDRVTSKFAHWGNTLGSHSGFKSLMTMFHDDTPIAVKALKSLVSIIKIVAGQMTGMSTFGNSKMFLQVANAVLSFTNSLLKAHPQLVWLILYLKLGAGGFGKLKSAITGVASGVGDIKKVSTAMKNLHAGLSDSAKAAEESTGAWGTFGGTLSKLKISNLTAGFKDADAAAADSTGILGTLGGKASTVWSAISSGASSFGSTMASAGSAVATFVSGFVVKTGEAMAATGAWIAEHAVAAGSFIAENVTMAVSATAAFVAENAATLGLVAGIGLLVAGIVYLGMHWKTVWKDIKVVALDAWHFIDDGLIHPLEHGVDDLVSFVESHWKLLATIIATVLLGPVGGLVVFVATHWAMIRHDTASLVDDVVNFFEQLPGRIVHAIGDLGSMLFHAGENAFEGLLHGMQSMVGRAIGDASNWGHDIVNAVGSAFGIHFSEPSEAVKMIAAGQRAGQGFGKGLMSTRGFLAATAAQVSRAAVLSGGYGASAGGGGGTGRWVEAKLVASGAEGALLTWLMEQVKLYIRDHGGGTKDSVQRALGQNA